MPSLKGDMICRTLREMDKYKNLPILIYTAFTEYKAEFFKQSGATDVLYKPADKIALLAKIEKLLPN